MIIDNNSKEKEAMEAFHSGDRPLGYKLQDEFVNELRDSLGKMDHCTCKKRVSIMATASSVLRYIGRTGNTCQIASKAW